MTKICVLILVLFFFECVSTQDIVTLKIASKQVDCQGVVKQKCLLVKKGDQKKWQYFYDGIEGFNYEPGFEYVLQIEEEAVANPPADGSSIRYKLIKQVSKTKKEMYNTLVWSDEFEGSGPIDTDKWFHQTQLPPGGSWWGGIIQHYTNRESNTYVKNGRLHLVAKKERFTDQGVTKNYTAARLNSKIAFTYGRVEVKAKLPKGKGTWPAIWMLNKNIDEDGAYWDNKGFGTTKWPYCGEFDIMEHWGKNQDYVSSALHNGSSYGAHVKNVGGQQITKASDEFHIYGLEWSEQKMVFRVDGKVHLEYQPQLKDSDTWPYDTDYYFILNIAIEPDIDPNFTESAMEVDYIRVYQ